MTSSSRACLAVQSFCDVIRWTSDVIKPHIIGFPIPLWGHRNVTKTYLLGYPIILWRHQIDEWRHQVTSVWLSYHYVTSSWRSQVSPVWLASCPVTSPDRRVTSSRTKSADCGTNRHQRQMRYNLTSEHQRRRTTVETTANHVRCSGPDELKDGATCAAVNSHNAVDNELLRSVEDQDTCTTKTTNTDIATVNR